MTLAPAWVPTTKTIAGSNLAWLMRAAGVDDYTSLHAWSVQQRAEYWRLAIERLQIHFRRPWSQLLDVSAGTDRARWLVGAELNIVESCFQADPRSAAIIYQFEGAAERTVSVAELRTLSSRVANALVARGIGAGDAVALILPMTPEAVAAYLGIIATGAVAVGIADSFSAAEIGTRLKLSDAKLVITQDEILRGGKRHDLYARVRAAAAPPTVVLPASGALSVALRSEDVAWADFLSPQETFEPVIRQADDPLTTLFSSGTTGEPKVIPWSQLCPLKCAADAHFHHDVRPGDRLAWPTSMGWMMGPWLIFAALLNRATIALYSGAPTDRRFAEFVARAGVTLLGVVPSLVSAWRTSGCLQGLDWSRLRVLSSTGECSNAGDMQWLMEEVGGKPMIEYCGGTEIAGAYITGTVVGPNYPATFQTPALGLDVVILDEQGQPAEKGEVFLLPPSIGLSSELLNADHQAIYYADCPRGPGGETLRRHGDAMERLPNGYYRAHGRVDDTMNLGGIKVSAAEIERVLNRVSGVRETAVVAEPPPGGGPSRLVVHAVMQEARPLAETEQEMQSAIRRELNPLFKIHRLEFVEALPRTASNKVMRRLLRGKT
jgi:acetyl-CoA synthetase